jgi:hypothetical protein
MRKDGEGEQPENEREGSKMPQFCTLQAKALSNRVQKGRRVAMGWDHFNYLRPPQQTLRCFFFLIPMSATSSQNAVDGGSWFVTSLQRRLAARFSSGEQKNS